MNIRYDDIRRIKGLLSRAGFSEKGILEHLGAEGEVCVEPREIPRLLRQTSGGTALDCFIRLFLMGAPVSAGDLKKAIAPMTISAWERIGMIRINAGIATAPVKLMPFADYLVAFDPSPRHTDREAKLDHVNGFGEASVNLINATLRRDIDTALDLGTGCGIQGMLCAAHSRRVVSTDINPRALNLVAFNAALNGIRNIEYRNGSLFDPVEGERFDLITMNPPFAISPDNRFLFRDSGMADDGFVRRILQVVPRYLTDEGFCQVTAQWAHVSGQDWHHRIAEWVAGNGCDVWVLKMKTQSAATYAANWITETEKHTPDSYKTRWEAWMSFLDARNIEAVSTGIICLRRAPGANWFSVNEDAEQIDEYGGEAIFREFLLRAWLNERSNTDLLDIAFEMNSDFVIEQKSKPGENGLTIRNSLIRMTKGVYYVGNIDPLMIGLIKRCDGKTPLGSLLKALANALHRQEDTLRQAVLEIVRNLIERGFLLPRGSGFKE